MAINIFHAKDGLFYVVDDKTMMIYSKHEDEEAAHESANCLCKKGGDPPGGS